MSPTPRLGQVVFLFCAYLIDDYYNIMVVKLFVWIYLYYKLQDFVKFRFYLPISGSLVGAVTWSKPGIEVGA